MFTALVLVCVEGMMNPEDCYYFASSRLYDSYSSCKIATNDMLNDTREEIEWTDLMNNFQWKITKVKCVDWNAEFI